MWESPEDEAPLQDLISGSFAASRACSCAGSDQARRGVRQRRAHGAKLAPAPDRYLSSGRPAPDQPQRRQQCPNSY